MREASFLLDISSCHVAPFCYLLRDLTYSLVHFTPRAIEKAYFAFILAAIFSILTCFDTRSYLIHLAIEQTITVNQRPGGVVCCDFQPW
jgi:hypothetical protein